MVVNTSGIVLAIVTSRLRNQTDVAGLRASSCGLRENRAVLPQHSTRNLQPATRNLLPQFEPQLADGYPYEFRFAQTDSRMTSNRRIEIYDTTLRDGTQGEGFNLSLQDKLAIAVKLDELGVDYIEGGFPLSNPKDAAFFQEVRKLTLHNARIAAFGMTRRRASNRATIRALRHCSKPTRPSSRSWEKPARCR